MVWNTHCGGIPAGKDFKRWDAEVDHELRSGYRVRDQPHQVCKKDWKRALSARRWQPHYGGNPKGADFSSLESRLDLELRTGSCTRSAANTETAMTSKKVPSNDSAWSAHWGAFRGEFFDPLESRLDACLRTPHRPESASPRAPGRSKSLKSFRSAGWVENFRGSPRGDYFSKLESRLDRHLRNKYCFDEIKVPEGRQPASNKAA
eukprot:TRINITY_DN24121_c0_g1_i1.p1 TRINITY_DN24121_c0_g1~~TRINITY_DN24121_c0_g1_i1.p1  ORF type:complete len:213 (-),score=16.28 TRINITY_DN24121_c0_g1_i1:208-822(-)